MAAATRSFTRALARSSLRPVVRSSARPAAAIPSLRATGYRGYSSESGSSGAGKSNNTAILLGVGAVALGGAGVYYLNTSSDAKAKSGPFQPTKEDYQKVYDEIARLLAENTDYDDGSYGPVCYFFFFSVHVRQHIVGGFPNANWRGFRFSCVSRGTLVVPMIRRLVLVAATAPPCGLRLSRTMAPTPV